MRVARNRVEARWLPSRSHFAIFRLIGFLRLRSAQRVTRPGLILVIDEYQNASENYLLSFVVVPAIACYATAFVQPRFGIIAALLAGVAAVVLFAFIGLIAAQVIASSGIALTDHKRINSVILLTIVSVASAYFAVGQLWVRWIGGLVLAGVALNILAAFVVWLIRDSVRTLEREYEEPG